MAKEGSKKVPIAGIDDKQQITLVLAAAMTNKLLPLQLVFQRKTKACLPTVDYDSLLTELNQESYDLILRIFHTRINDDRRTTVVMKELKKQKGSTDCGLFAIAVITSMAHKEDTSTTKYDQYKMRQHLMDCFSNKFLMPFPKL